MRRYPDGTLLYEPDDPVAVSTDAGLLRGRIMSHAQPRRGEDYYRVCLDGKVRRVAAAQIIKEADSGGRGFVQHLPEGRLI